MRVEWMKGVYRVLPLFAILLTASLSAQSRHHFSMKFDYRFAGSCVAAPEARRTFDAVANMYGRLIEDDFPEVPAGTAIRVWNAAKEQYEEVTLTEPIDDVLVFVFCADWGNSGTKAAAAPVGSPWAAGSVWERRWTQKPFQPWAIRVSINSSGGRPWFFDPTPESDDDLPSQTHYDLFQSLLHEIGHGLGLIRNESPFVFTDLVREDKFYGPNAMKWNNGEPVPLAANSSHIRGDFNRGLLRPNLDRYMMHSSDIIQGFRSYPKQLDMAMLKDIGYHLNPVEEGRILALSAPGPDDPRRKQYEARHPDFRTNRRLPVGLWYLDDPRLVNSAITGRPLRIMPAPALPASHHLPPANGGLLVPKGAFLIVDHGIAANGGGKEVNQYSLVLDINLPELGKDYGLYNTAYANSEGNAAEAFINKSNQLGQGNYSSFQFKAGLWYRVTIAVDIAANERTYFVDGVQVLTQEAGALDGRHALGAVGGPSTPLFCLFADGNGDRADIQVQRVALYPYKLTAAQAQALGKAGDSRE